LFTVFVSALDERLKEGAARVGVVSVLLITGVAPVVID
jgi:hypothetical protein